eukprot:5625910-Alexandrium_andersonii.AAC.1
MSRSLAGLQFRLELLDLSPHARGWLRLHVSDDGRIRAHVTDRGCRHHRNIPSCPPTNRLNEPRGEDGLRDLRTPHKL